MPDADRREQTQPYRFTPPTLDDSGVRRKPFHPHGPASEPTQLSVGSNGPISATLLAAQVPSVRPAPPSRETAPPASQPTTMIDLVARRASAIQRIAHGAMEAKVAREAEAARAPVRPVTLPSIPSLVAAPPSRGSHVSVAAPPAWVMPTPHAMMLPTLAPGPMPSLTPLPVVPPPSSRGTVLAAAAAVALVAVSLVLLVVVRGPGRVTGAVEAPPAPTAALQPEPVAMPAPAPDSLTAPPGPAPSIEAVTAPPEVVPAPAPAPPASSSAKSERHTRAGRSGARVTLPKHTSAP